MINVRRFVPRVLHNLRHWLYAWWGSVIYRQPSQELLVIGVTGTSGKSTTVYLLRQLLEAAGHTVGALSTIEFYLAGNSKLNDKKMTMLGRTQIQKYLRAMVRAKCDIAIIETTSEGAVQFRHRFVNYDTIVLTNLYPEHIESHGSFDAYKAAKLGIFSYVANGQRKKLNGVQVPKTAIVYGHSEYAPEFLAYPFEKKIVFGRADKPMRLDAGTHDRLQASAIRATSDGLYFSVEDQALHAPILGAHNVMNILSALVVARSLGIGWPTIAKAVTQFRAVPGRLEFISEARSLGIRVMVDYAFEPVAIEALYQVIKSFQPKKIIHVFGAAGGGRDRARRAILGKFIGEQAQICLVTNEDPYDEDPMAIVQEVASAVRSAGKIDDETLFIIGDRRDAIEKAIGLASPGDMVLITGKGSEQGIVARGRIIPWDDRVVARQIIIEELALQPQYEIK